MAKRPTSLEGMDEGLARLLDCSVLSSTGEPGDDRRADEVLVRVLGDQLRNLLAARRMRGLSGWHTKKGINARLLAELKAHVAEGRMLEAIRTATIIHARTHLYGPEA